MIQNFGVQIHKVARTAMEIERKIFHLTGMISCTHGLIFLVEKS